MATTPNWLTNSPLVPKEKIDENKMEKLKSASNQFNVRPGSRSSSTEPTPYGSVSPNYKEQCDKLRKSDLEKIMELQKQLEECHSGGNENRVVKKIKEAGRSLKRSLKDRFGPQNGGKRKKTKRRRRKRKTRRNRKTRRHKR